MPSFDRPADTTIPPSPWVTRWSPLIKEDCTVLDVAAGNGRHTRFLREKGFRVVTSDIDTSGLNDLTGDPYIEIVAADLEIAPWPFAGKLFGGIVVTNYLHRPHFPLLISVLASGGVLIFETFGQGNEQLGRPRNPDFLLKPGELLEAFAPHLHIVAYEHGEERAPRPAVRQRICAVKGSGPYTLPRI
jgi:SAM-dependent methyltransferase